MKKHFFVVLSTIILSVNLLAQEIVLSETVHDTIIIEKGSGGKQFGYLYMNLGFYAGPAEDMAEIKYGNSVDFNFGFQQRFKTCSRNAIGWDLSFDYNYFRLDNEKNPITISPDLKKERIDLYNFRFAIFDRIYLKKMYAKEGLFLDLGAFGNWAFADAHYSLLEPEDENFERVEITESKLDYIENYGYGVLCRLGYNQFVLTAKYRLSDIVKNEDVIKGEFPRLSIGIQIDMHD